MRTNLILPLFLILLIFGCDKEEEVSPLTLEEQLQGEWVTVNQTYIYYEGNTEVYRESVTEETTMRFKDNTVTSVYDDGTARSGTFNLSGNKISLIQNNEAMAFDVLNISENGMEWKGNIEEMAYYNNGLKTSDYAIVSIRFKRK